MVGTMFSRTTVKKFTRPTFIKWPLLATFLIFLPWIVLIIPIYGANNFTYSQLNLWLILAVAAVGLNILTGLTGMISVGHSAIYAVGAFVCGYFTSIAKLPFVPSLVLAAIGGTLVALILGLPALKLSGPYLAIATFGFAVGVPQFLSSSKELGALFADPNDPTTKIGVFQVPRQTFPGFDVKDELGRYYLFLAIAAVMVLIALGIWHSRTGRAFRAIRDSETAAQAMGVHIGRYKVLAFMISGAFAGVAGGMYSAQVGQLEATDLQFGAIESVIFLTAIILGGLGTVWGAVIGSAVLIFLPNATSELRKLIGSILNYNIDNFESIFYGLIIILCIFFMPNGLAGAATNLYKRLRDGKKNQAAEAQKLEKLEESLPITEDMITHRLASDEAYVKNANPDAPGHHPDREKLLEIQNLEISFGGLKAVSDFSMEVRRGEIIGLIGPNGAGKTTVFNCTSRFYKPNKGKVLVEGTDLTRLSAEAAIEHGIARTFQNVELFKTMTVLENLLIGQHIRMKQTFFEDALRLPTSRKADEKAKKHAMQVLTALGIGQYAHTPVAILPFGVQKMVEMARALVCQPKLILLDEPAAGSNPHETYRLAALIKHLRDDWGVTVLLVEHDMSLVMDICDRLYVLDFGKKIAEGTPSEVQNNPAVIEAYLGEREEVLD